MDYATTADTLAERILALIPANPHILDLDSPWGLFKVEGFKCDDLQPSMAQAAGALSKAKAMHRQRTSSPEPTP